MSELTREPGGLDRIYQQIRSILTEARHRAWRAANEAMVKAYWEVGRVIVEEEQRGGARAEYGRRLVEGLSTRLSAEFGKGFDRSNLWNMRAFYLTFPILDALRRELTWTHYRLLLRVNKPEARAFYEAEAVNARWSTREQMYVNYYQREIAAPEENPPIGIVLCTDKNEAVVRYTLPEGNTQIFASRYQLYLPTEEELSRELQREREQIELERRLADGAPGE